jgi:hypothetical protein
VIDDLSPSFLQASSPPFPQQQWFNHITMPWSSAQASAESTNSTNFSAKVFPSNLSMLLAMLAGRGIGIDIPVP